MTHQAPEQFGVFCDVLRPSHVLSYLTLTMTLWHGYFLCYIMTWLKLRNVKWLSCVCRANNWWGQDANLGGIVSEGIPFYDYIIRFPLHSIPTYIGISLWIFWFAYSPTTVEKPQLQCRFWLLVAFLPCNLFACLGPIFPMQARSSYKGRGQLKCSRLQIIGKWTEKTKVLLLHIIRSPEAGISRISLET